jgi:hypothetical protein
MSRLDSFSLERGIPKSFFLEISDEIRQSRNPLALIQELKNNRLPLASLALMQGQAELALNIGLEDPFERLTALIFNGQRVAAEQFLESLKGQESEDTIALLTLFSLRTSNKSAQALQVFEPIKARIDQIQPDHLRLDILLQGGSVYFNCSKFDESFNAYQMAFELARALGRKSKAAIAAFNASISLSYLNRDLECKTWLWFAEEIISNYHFEHLGNSIELSRLEKMRDDGHHQECLTLGSLYLQQPHLSVIQRVLALQAVMKSHLEQGLVFEAEALLNQSRAVMVKNSYYQFELFQRALELDLEVMVNRRVLRGQLLQSPSANTDVRALRAMKIAQARKATTENDLNRTLRLISEIKRESQDLPDDLALLESENLSEIPSTARGQEIFMFLACQKHKVSALERLNTHLSERHELNPWQTVIAQLCQGFISFFNGDKTKAETRIREAVHKAENLGLERLVSIGLGICVNLDPSVQDRWVAHLNQLDDIEKTWLENILKMSFSIQLNPGKWVFSKDQKRLVSAQQLQSASENAELIINKELSRVELKGQELPVRGLLYKILLALAEAKEAGLGKQDLVRIVWQQNYDPSMHDAVIYNNVGRLRDFIPVDLQDGCYRLAPSLKWILIDGVACRENIVNLRQSLIIGFLKQNPVGMQRNQAKDLIKASERTALRELTELVQIGILKKTGSGRSVTYLLAE